MGWCSHLLLSLQAAQMDRYRELRALLRLLTHVTQRDLVDFGTAEGEASVDIAQVGSGSTCCAVALCASITTHRSTPCIRCDFHCSWIHDPNVVHALVSRMKTQPVCDRLCSWDWTSSFLSSPKTF